MLTFNQINKQSTLCIAILIICLLYLCCVQLAFPVVCFMLIITAMLVYQLDNIRPVHKTRLKTTDQVISNNCDFVTPHVGNITARDTIRWKNIWSSVDLVKWLRTVLLSPNDDLDNNERDFEEVERIRSNATMNRTMSPLISGLLTQRLSRSTATNKNLSFVNFCTNQTSKIVFETNSRSPLLPKFTKSTNCSTSLHSSSDHIGRNSIGDVNFTPTHQSQYGGLGILPSVCLAQVNRSMLDESNSHLLGSAVKGRIAPPDILRSSSQLKRRADDEPEVSGTVIETRLPAKRRRMVLEAFEVEPMVLETNFDLRSLKRPALRDSSTMITSTVAAKRPCISHSSTTDRMNRGKSYMSYDASCMANSRWMHRKTKVPTSVDCTSKSIKSKLSNDSVDSSRMHVDPVRLRLGYFSSEPSSVLSTSPTIPTSSMQLAASSIISSALSIVRNTPSPRNTSLPRRPSSPRNTSSPRSTPSPSLKDDRIDSDTQTTPGQRSRSPEETIRSPDERSRSQENSKGRRHLVLSSADLLNRTPPHAACLTADDVEQDRSLEKERLQWMLAESIKAESIVSSSSKCAVNTLAQEIQNKVATTFPTTCASSAGEMSYSTVASTSESSTESSSTNMQQSSPLKLDVVSEASLPVGLEPVGSKPTFKPVFGVIPSSSTSLSVSFPTSTTTVSSPGGFKYELNSQEVNSAATSSTLTGPPAVSTKTSTVPFSFPTTSSSSSDIFEPQPGIAPRLSMPMVTVLQQLNSTANSTKIPTMYTSFRTLEKPPIFNATPSGLYNSYSTNEAMKTFENNATRPSFDQTNVTTVLGTQSASFVPGRNLTSPIPFQSFGSSLGPQPDIHVFSNGSKDGSNIINYSSSSQTNHQQPLFTGNAAIPRAMPVSSTFQTISSGSLQPVSSSFPAFDNNRASGIGNASISSQSTVTFVNSTNQSLPKFGGFGDSRDPGHLPVSKTFTFTSSQPSFANFSASSPFVVSVPPSNGNVPSMMLSGTSSLFNQSSLPPSYMSLFGNNVAASTNMFGNDGDKPSILTSAFANNFSGSLTNTVMSLTPAQIFAFQGSSGNSQFTNSLFSFGMNNAQPPTSNFGFMSGSFSTPAFSTPSTPMFNIGSSGSSGTPNKRPTARIRRPFRR